MAVSEYYVDAGGGNDTTGDGTIGTPWATIQKAFSTITHNATDGDRVNVKAGTAQVLTATLDDAALGSVDGSHPVRVQGYTSTAADGGIAEIDCGGFQLHDGGITVHWIDLELHTFGNNHGVVLNSSGGNIINCEVHRGASTPSGKALVSCAGQNMVYGCHLHDAGTSNGLCIDGNNSVAVLFSRFSGQYEYGARFGGGVAAYNVFTTTAGYNVAAYIHTWQFDAPGVVIHNSIYGKTGDGRGMRLEDGRQPKVTVNNIIANIPSGEGIEWTTNQNNIIGPNAFWNVNTVHDYQDTAATLYDFSADNISLGSDPFVDGANGDFTISDSDLLSLGYPQAFPGLGWVNYPFMGAMNPERSAGGGRQPRARFHGV